MQKEILTKEKCKTDLLEATRGKIGFFVYFTAAALFLFSGADYLAWDLCRSAAKLPGWCFPAATVLLSVGPIILTALLVRAIRNVRMQKRRIQNGKFRIVEDRLVRSVHDADCMKPDRTSLHHNGFYRGDAGGRDLLVFADYGDFYILHYDYYKWSKLYFMSADGLFNTALVGDTFYLVIYDGDRKNEPVMVYNTKIFKLKEDEALDPGI